MPRLAFSQRTAFEAQPNPWALALQKARRKGRLYTALIESNPTKAGLSPHTRLPPSTGYTPHAQGLASARKALSKALGHPTLYPRLCLTSGTSEALGLAFKLLGDMGDEIVAGMPGYPLVQTLATFEGLHCIPFPLRLEGEAFRWDIPLLEKQLSPRTKAVLATHPQAPTGCCLLREEVLALEALCAKHGLALIIDEVFALPQHSLAGHPWKCLTFLLGGLSKGLGLPQHKLAWTWVLGPKALAHKALQRWLWVADAYLCLATPVQKALPTWLPMAKAFEQRVETRCKNNHACLAKLRPQGAAWSLFAREAGWTAVLRIPISPKEEPLTLQLLEAGVALWPGYFFEFPVPGFVVASLLAPEAAFEEAARHMVQVFEALWGQTT
ncbi:MAG: pyridoxal phosphate-dependent aminotransferase [Cystobacterineae bacterium]|nr:pyridoxal phosphate-dependent aminotransferase [Cystobacterineae bacterium]